MSSEEKTVKKDDNLKKNIFKRGFVWRPVPNIIATVSCFGVIGIAFLVVGIILLVYSKKIKEEVIRYDNLDECKNAITAAELQDRICTLSLNLTETFESPVMIYYQLENFYQNHRRYIKSFSPKQLKGKILSVNDIEDDCDPIVRVRDLGINTTISGEVLDPDAPANPCGLIARSFFNDSFKIFKKDDDGLKEIDISDKGLAWDSDKKGRYKRPENYENIQWTDVENERFMVWMRPAGLPDFRKLWGKIEADLTPGTYIINVTNNYPVDSFDGKKSFVISTVNSLGGKNTFLGVSYLVVGALGICFAIILLVAHMFFNKEKTE